MTTTVATDKVDGVAMTRAMDMAAMMVSINHVNL
jgi:hypothetical protein